MHAARTVFILATLMFLAAPVGAQHYVIKYETESRAEADRAGQRNPCVVGVGAILPSHEVGCAVCRASPGNPPYYANYMCIDGKAKRISECSFGKQACPEKEGPFCHIYGSHFIPLGETACFVYGWDSDTGRKYYEYGECIGRNRYRSIDTDIDPSDPRCTRIIDPRP